MLAIGAGTMEAVSGMVVVVDAEAVMLIIRIELVGSGLVVVQAESAMMRDGLQTAMIRINGCSVRW